MLAQVFWVTIVVIISVVDFFTTAVDDSTIGVGIAVNCLWVWMIPITLGFVWVGTQNSAGTIRNALMKSEMCLIVGERSEVHQFHHIKGMMECLRDRQGEDAGNSNQPDPESYDRSARRKRILGVSTGGLEMEPGAIFNYARAQSHLRTAQVIIDAFEALNTHLENKFRDTVFTEPNGREFDPQDWVRFLEGSPAQIKAWIFPNGYSQPQFAKDLPHNPVVPWFCSGEAPAPRYLWLTSLAPDHLSRSRHCSDVPSSTPVNGLGCDSGAYLIYGALATASWLFLVWSANLSQR